MTVMELIEKLRKIEDKSKIILHYDDDDIEVVIDVIKMCYCINMMSLLTSFYGKRSTERRKKRIWLCLS